MNDFEKYLYSILDSLYNEAKPLIDEIRKIDRCTNCGGVYDDGVCDHCFCENDELKEQIERLSKIIDKFEYQISNLPIHDMPINKFFNLLHSISNVNISCISKLMEKYNYVNSYNMFVEEALNRMRSDELTDLDISVFETLIYRNDNDKGLYPVYLDFIKRALLKKKNISFECFSKMMEQFVEIHIKKFYSNPVCTVKNSDEMKNIHQESDLVTLGTNLYNHIDLLDETVRDLYYDGSGIIFETIFHELTHTFQCKEIFSSDGHFFSELAIRELKDHILANNCSNYKKENYSFLSYEHEANYVGIITMINFLNVLGFEVGHKYKEQLEELLVKINERRRILNGQESDLDTIFNDFIKVHPEIVREHSQLSKIYNIDNCVVVPKSEEEIKALFFEPSNEVKSSNKM